jgi:hypothetical protein
LPTELIINNAGIDRDFRVESDGNANMLFVDGGANAVGIGTNAPASYYSTSLVVSGPDEDGITILSPVDAAGYLMFADGTSGNAAYRGYLMYDHGPEIFVMNSAANVQINATNTYSVAINEGGYDVDFRVESDSNANALFMDASTSYVGINRSPAVELDVQRISTSYPLRISASDGSARTMVFADSAGSPSRVNWLAGAQYNTDNGWELTPSTANGGYTFTNRVLTAYSYGTLVVNENGIDADFRVESNDNSHMLYVDGGLNLVGFNASTAASVSGASFLVYAGGMKLDIGHNGSAASGDQYVAFRRNGTTLGSITQNSASGVLYNTTSDQRLKENIADADDSGNLIDAIQVRKFDWKVDGSHQDYGMVAQELQAVAPEAVSVPEDSDEMMSVDYSKLVPMLIKEIQSLRARVADLES